MELRFQLEGIGTAAGAFWQAFPTQTVFAFHGGMGAGKTTFIHALCLAKGVTDTVGSPTFSIINEYRYPGGSIFHLDLYRLKDQEEAAQAGVEDVLFSDQPMKDYRDTLKGDKTIAATFNKLLRERGLMKGESKYYVSLAHTQADIDHTINAWSEAVKLL